MGRPKKSQPGEQARAKLQQAFWDLLETKSSSQVTVTLLAQKAGVNKNSFYYHYRNMDEFISDCLFLTFDRNIPLAMLSVLRGEMLTLRALMEGDEPLLRARRLVLFVRHCDSSAHLEMFKEEMMAVWLQVAGREKDEISKEDWLTLRFVQAGLFELIGNCAIPPLEDILADAEAASGNDANPDVLGPQTFHQRMEALAESKLSKRVASLVLPVLFPDEASTCL